MATLRELRNTIKDQEGYIEELEDKLAEIAGLSALVDEDEEGPDADSSDDEE